MGFFSNLFGFNPNIETPTKYQSFGWLSRLNGNKKVLEENFFEWYKTNPFIYSAINERAKAVSNAMFYIKTPDGEKIQNALTEALNKPNEYQSKEEFLKQLITFQSIWGTGYVYANKLRPSKAIGEFEFINIPTDKIHFDDLVNRDYFYETLRFEKKPFKISYVRTNGKSVPLLNENLIPFFDTAQFSNPYYSESRMRALRYAVSNIQSALESQNTFLSTPGGIGMVVKRRKNESDPIMLMEPQRSMLEKDMQNDYGSLSGQKNIQIVGQDVDFISTMPNVESLELNTTMVNNALTIYGVFDLPKELLTALQNGSTFENQKQAYKRYLQSAAQDLVNSIAGSFDTMYPSNEGTLIGSFDHLPIMQDDEKEKADIGKIDAETIKSTKEVYDDWINRNFITEQQYKEKFNL